MSQDLTKEFVIIESWLKTRVGCERLLQRILSLRESTHQSGLQLQLELDSLCRQVAEIDKAAGTLHDLIKSIHISQFGSVGYYLLASRDFLQLLKNFVDTQQLVFIDSGQYSLSRDGSKVRLLKNIEAPVSLQSNLIREIQLAIVLQF